MLIQNDNLKSVFFVNK